MPACPICRQPSDTLSLTDPAVHHGIGCQRCGRYGLTFRATVALTCLNPTDRRLPALAAYIRGANKMNDIPTLHAQEWKVLASGHLHTSVATKLRLVLEHVAALSRRPGESVAIDGAVDYPLFDAVSTQEVGYLVETLVDRGDLKGNSVGSLTLTAQGWGRLDDASNGGVQGAY